MIGVNVGFQRTAQAKAEFADERDVAPGLFEDGVDQDRLTAVGIAEKIGERRRLRIEHLPEYQHEGRSLPCPPGHAANLGGKVEGVLPRLDRRMAYYSSDMNDSTPDPNPPAAEAPLKGAARIQSYLKTLPDAPGVYRMLNAKGDVLYVGKAKSLKKRVAAYTKTVGHSYRIARMISETVEMIFIATASETEALLLEANLIKRLKPRYNVLFRDDKSFPNILLRTDHPFPQILKHRGAKSHDGIYFGPFAAATAVNSTLNTLQRAFLLRSCSDAVFSGRTRPCLLHQIKRCSAPCTGRIDAEGYAALVARPRTFSPARAAQCRRHWRGRCTTRRRRWISSGRRICATASGP